MLVTPNHAFHLFDLGHLREGDANNGLLMTVVGHEDFVGQTGEIIFIVGTSMRKGLAHIADRHRDEWAAHGFAMDAVFLTEMQLKLKTKPALTRAANYGGVEAIYICDRQGRRFAWHIILSATGEIITSHPSDDYADAYNGHIRNELTLAMHALNEAEVRLSGTFASRRDRKEAKLAFAQAAKSVRRWAGMSGLGGTV